MAFPVRLTVLENLKVFAGIYNVRDPARKIDELLERFGIGRLKNKPISRLSSGETTRVGLCKAFLNNPELLLLDEPTAYLDFQAAIQVRDVLLELQRNYGTTILYTSHNMHEVQRMCDRIIFLSHGKVVDNRNSDRRNSQDSKGGPRLACSRRGLHSHRGARAR